MDALVNAALERVNKTIDNINWEYPQDTDVAKAIYAIDALKFSLKSISTDHAQSIAGKTVPDAEERAQYLKYSAVLLHQVTS